MLIACPDCAAIQALPPLRASGVLRCQRCDIILERTNGRRLDLALSCSITTFLLLFPANFLAALTVISPLGLSASIHLATGIGTIWGQRWPFLAIGCLLLAIILPFLRFGLLSLTLLAIRRGARGAWIGRAFRYANALDMWAMPDVLLIGALIGYGRVVPFLPVRIDLGGYCFFAAALLSMITRASLDRRAIWRFIEPPPVATGPDPVSCTSCDLVLPASMEGRRCPRCEARVHRRKPHALMRALALVMAGYVLLPVSNYFPMTILYRLGMVQQRLTIFRGIQLLFDNGHLPLAVLLSCTSLGIPIAKLMVMTWLFVSIGTRSDRALRWKTKTYRIVDEMGRWSNLDPFAVMIYAPMVQFGSLARVEVGLGSPSFLAVVVVSMLAARVFDPRLIWDFSKYPDRPLIRAVGQLIEAPATGQADQDDQLEAKSA